MYHYPGQNPPKAVSLSQFISSPYMAWELHLTFISYCTPPPPKPSAFLHWASCSYQARFCLRNWECVLPFTLNSRTLERPSLSTLTTSLFPFRFSPHPALFSSQHTRHIQVYLTPYVTVSLETHCLFSVSPLECKIHQSQDLIPLHPEWCLLNKL